MAGITSGVLCATMIHVDYSRIGHVFKRCLRGEIMTFPSPGEPFRQHESPGPAPAPGAPQHQSGQPGVPNEPWVQGPPGYGQPQPQAPPLPGAWGPNHPYVAPKNPAVAVIASLFIPGLGSMISGNGGMGALILILYVISVGLSLILIGIPFAIGIWIWGMVQGHKDAVRWNQSHGIIS